MKVLKVIVDELPEGCENCIYGRIVASEQLYAMHKFLDVRWCNAAQKMIFDDSLVDGKPDWCPLVVEPKLTNFSAKGVEVTQDGKVIFTGNIIYNEQTGDFEFIESDPQ